MDMRFGTWNVRSMCKAAVKYKLDLVRVQQIRWAGGGSEFAERGMRIMNQAEELLCIRELYQQLRGLSLLVIGCHTQY
jgi:hypothetical protein